MEAGFAGLAAGIVTRVERESQPFAICDSIDGKGGARRRDER